MHETSFYIYKHSRKNNNQVFYIGLGKIRRRSINVETVSHKYERAYSKLNRNSYWHNIINKHNYEVEIIAENLSKEEACELEIFLISSYGRRDLGTGTLVNMTDGGEGVSGFSPPPEQRNSVSMKMKGTRTGKDNPMFGKNWRLDKSEEELILISKNFSESRRGTKNPVSKKVINTITKDVFGTPKEASQFYKISLSTLYKRLGGFYPNTTNLMYLNDYERINK